jgi:hypothetical protein
MRARLILPLLLFLAVLLATASAFAQTTPSASFTLSDPGNLFGQGTDVALNLTNASFSWAEANPDANGRLNEIIITAAPSAVTTQRWFLDFAATSDLVVGTYFLSNGDMQFVAELTDTATNQDTVCQAVDGTVTVSNLEQDTTTGANAPTTRLTSLGAQFAVQCISGETIAGAVTFTPVTTPTPTPEPTPQPPPTGRGGVYIGSPLRVPNPPVTTTPSAPTVLAPSLIVILPATVVADPVAISTASTADVAVRTVATSTGFPAGAKLTVRSDPSGLGLSLSPSTVAAPGNGTSTLTINTANTPVGTYRVFVTATAADGTTATSSFRVNVFCDPPTILGIDQPRTTVLSLGQSATLTAKPTGSGPFTYQWFEGFTGQTSFPVANATSATFTTGALQNTTQYWVRVANGCGSVDSQAATLLIPGH